MFFVLNINWKVKVHFQILSSLSFVLDIFFFMKNDVHIKLCTERNTRLLLGHVAHYYLH